MTAFFYCDKCGKQSDDEEFTQRVEISGITEDEIRMYLCKKCREELEAWALKRRYDANKRRRAQNSGTFERNRKN